MKFQLFLNHLSSSQTIKTRNAMSAVDCYTTCNPYNCAMLSVEEKNSERNSYNLFERMKKWKIRPEQFGFLIYDNENNRLYETDEDGYSSLKKLIAAETYSSFFNILKNDQKCSALYSSIKAVFI
jgi:hypothetical protein